MKILHVVPSYIPAYRYGGPVEAVHGLCAALAAKGDDVTVFTTDMDGGGRLDVPYGEPVDMDGVRVFYYRVGLMRPYCYSPGLGRAMRERVAEFDLVHIHSVYLYPTMIAARLCRRAGVPYIINPFGALDPFSISLSGRLKKSLYINLVERRNIRGARLIHAASSYERDRIRSLGFGTPVAVVPRGVRPGGDESAEGGKALAEMYPQLNGRKIILFLGRLHRKKGLDLLAAAFEKVAREREDVCLVLAGSGEGRYEAGVRRLFAGAGMKGRAVFTGMLLGRDKTAAFRGSDIFVLPSRGENFGIAALEAMAAGLPVIVTDKVGLYPDIGEYKAGVVTGCDPDSIAGAMLFLLDNAGSRHSMGENGRRLAADRFDWNGIAGRMKEAYGDAIDGISV